MWAPSASRFRAPRVLGDRQLHVDGDGEPVTHEVQHGGELAVAAHGGADDLVLLEEQPREVDLHDGPGRPAAHHEPAARRQGSDRTVPGGRSDALDHDLAAHRPVVLGVEGRRGAGLLGPPARRCVARGAVHGRPHRPSQVQRRHRDPTTDPDDQHRLARSEAGAPQHAVGRERRQREGSALRPGPADRPTGNVARRHRHQLAVTAPALLAEDLQAGVHRRIVAVGDDRIHRADRRVDHDLIARRPGGDLRADGLDDAGDVAPGHVGTTRAGLPRVNQRSMWFRALATGRIRTSSGPTGGSAISPHR